MFIPVLLVVLVVAGTRWRSVIGYAGVATLAVVLVLMPWTIRNVRATDSFVPISTNLGDNLCMSRHSDATGGFQAGPACAVRARGLKTPEYEVEVNNTNIRRSVRFVKGHPLTEAKLVFLRGYHTVKNDYDGLLASESYGANPFIPSILRRVLEVVADAYFFVVVALGLLAVPAFVGRHRPWRLFFLLAAAALAVQPLIFFGDPRFHVPVLPFVAVLAAVTIARIRSFIATRGERPVTGTSPG